MYKKSETISYRGHRVSTISNACEKVAAQNPQFSALSYFGTRITHREFLERALCFSHFLKQVKTRKPVVIFLPTMPEFLYAAIGAMAAGSSAALVGIAAMHHALKKRPYELPADVRAQLEELRESDIIVCADIFLPFLKHMGREYLAGKHVVVADIGGSFPTAKKYLFAVSRLPEKLLHKSEYRLPDECSSVQFSVILKTSGADMPHDSNHNRACPDDTALFLFTSGTTGTPKKIPWTHRDLLVNTMQLYERMRPLVREEGIALNDLPLSHIYGLLCTLTALLLFRDTIALLPRFSAKLSLQTLREEKVDVWWGVNRMFSALIEACPDRKKWPRSFQNAICGAGSLDVRVREGMESGGATVTEGYGTTELGIFATEIATHAKGLLFPLHDVKVRIVREDGTTCLSGEEGLIMVSSPHLSRYAREGVLSCSTGDIGVMEESGGFRITGRENDLIKINGEKVWPHEIEAFIESLGMIRYCVAVGIPDEKRGESVGLCVADDRHADEICRMLAKKNPLWVPFKVAYITEDTYRGWITPLGKILRRKAREYLLNL